MDRNDDINNDTHKMTEIERNWHKTQCYIKTIGLGDGMSIGQDNNVQNYFNKGFSEGFRTGYQIGKCKGLMFGEATQKSLRINEDSLLEHPQRGWCQICVKNELLHENISHIIDNQFIASSKNMKRLHSLHS